MWPPKLTNPVKINLIRIYAYALLSALFMLMLYDFIEHRFFEDDLAWFIPSIHQLMAGKSLGEILYFILAPSHPEIGPEFGGTPLRILAVSLLTFFAPEMKYLIFLSLILHFTSSALLFLVGTKMGFGSRVSFLSALIYVAFYPHFHTYLWPMGMHHLFVVFFVLLVLNFYLKTDQLLTGGSRYQPYYALTLALNLMATFTRASILILPVLILSHIVFASEGKIQRARKYWIWFPLFATHLLVPLVAVLYDPVVNPGLRNALRLINFPPILISSPFAEFLSLFGLGLSALLLLGFILSMRWISRLERLPKWLPPSLFLALLLGIASVFLREPRVLLLPYNLLLVLARLLGSFVMPLENALVGDNTLRWHPISSQVNPLTFILAGLLIITFVKAFLLKNRHTVVLVLWYIFVVAALSVRYPDLTQPVYSRYFINVSPVFSLAFSSVLVNWYDYLLRRIRLGPLAKESLLILLVLSFGIINLAAIKLDMFRGKLTDSFFIYDYIRAAHLIKEDISTFPQSANIRSQDIYVDKLTILPYALYWLDFSTADIYQYSYDTFRYTLVTTLGDISMLRVNVNQTPRGIDQATVYSVDGEVIRRADGKEIGAFYQSFREGLEQMSLKQYDKALRSFEEAQRMRPFLLRYVLGEHPLEDLRWVTNGTTLRTHITRIASYYRFYFPPDEKVNYIAALMNRDITDYLEVLFYLMWLEYRRGNLPKAEFWISQVRYLDDYRNFVTTLSEVPEIRSDETLLDLLKNRFWNVLDSGAYPWYAIQDNWMTHRLGNFLLGVLR